MDGDASAAHVTMEADKVVSVAPERNETEGASEPEWNFDAEIIVIWVTGGVVLATLLGMLICLLATRKKSRSSTATIRASSFNFHRPGIDETVTSVYRPRGGENPAYSVTNDDANEWFGNHRPRVLNSLARPSDCVYLPDSCNQGNRQIWNSPVLEQSGAAENSDQQQMAIPPIDVSETGQTYQSGPPPPSPPPPLPQQSHHQQRLQRHSGDNRPTYIMENGEFILDPYFLATAPPPYTPYAEEHPVDITTIERSLTLPVRNGTSYR